MLKRTSNPIFISITNISKNQRILTVYIQKLINSFPPLENICSSCDEERQTKTVESENLPEFMSLNEIGLAIANVALKNYCLDFSFS